MATLSESSRASVNSTTTSTNGIANVKPSAAHKYRGAVVEDLQLPPAFTLPDDEVVDRAIEMAHDRDFSYIPILSQTRKPLGYLDVKALLQAEGINGQDSVTKYMTRFKRGPSHTYTVITPATPLDVVESFLEEKDDSFAIITDYGRNFVLGVATREDLEKFVTRSGFMSNSSFS
ncbi:hypothetical protein SCHPADRAFT_938162 [Schizopora paradoxa]|uniref:CBS domain-containing protein n=1 Tax=Schizopora paradoxa TaxID=27342 RepID=A0A0H2S302_9AGAM|nr:hypothetical protein SCHPADRAFT_938162 [Schizopora paradoxa]